MNKTKLKMLLTNPAELFKRAALRFAFWFLNKITHWLDC